MHGTNPIRKPIQGDGSSLEIQEIFPTFQGEGPFTGVPAVFIRLGGCNLACDFCDTEFESFKTMGLDEIIAQTVAFSEQNGQKTHNLVVITGGEPLRQPIEALCERLIAHGFTVQIETNGTIFRDLHQDVQLVCSPKNAGNGYFPIREDLASRINAYKFIISASHPLYKDIGPVNDNIPIYVQPMDEYDAQKNAANTARAVQLVQEHGYRLSLQTHKIVGAP